MVFSHELYADRPLENLSGGGGGWGERSTKKYIRARGNKMKKIDAR